MSFDLSFFHVHANNICWIYSFKDLQVSNRFNLLKKPSVSLIKDFSDKRNYLKQCQG